MANITPPPKVVRAPSFGKGGLVADSDQQILYSEDTGGAVSLGRWTMNPGDGSPLHIHTKEDEIYYVLSGEVEVIIDDERQILRSGDCVFLPRYVPHQLQNPGQKPAQVLLMIHPPGLEYFFEEMARLRSQGEPSREAVSKLIARYF